MLPVVSDDRNHLPFLKSFESQVDVVGIDFSEKNSDVKTDKNY